MDLNSRRCTTQQYASAYAPSQLDPIGGAAETQSQLAANPPKTVGADSVNGIRVKVVKNLASPEIRGKVWLDEKFSFIVKLVLAAAGGTETTAFEMRQLSYEPSPVSLFTPPSGCTQIGGVSTANGGHAEFTTDVNVQAQQPLSGATTAGNRPAATGGVDPFMGKWDFTGRDNAGVAWSGTLTIRELDPAGYDTNPCLYDPRTKTLSVNGGTRSAQRPASARPWRSASSAVARVDRQSETAAFPDMPL